MKNSQETLLLNFGMRIRELRMQAGLSQDDLAESAGLFRTYMSRIETGCANPTVVVINKLAEALNVAIAELFEIPHQTKAVKIRSTRAVSCGRVK